MVVTKFLDTYVLCEILNGNKDYFRYLSDDFVVNDVTLAEFYWVILRTFNEATAEFWLRQLQPYSLSYDLFALVKAMRFRKKYAPNNFSFFDSVGYTFAQDNRMVFVTGDKEFKDFANVEFVPAHKKH